MIFIGIDPGKHGAVGVIWDDGSTSVYQFEGGKSDMVEVLREVIEENTGSAFAALEAVHSMPKQGVASSFSFGETFGVIQGALYALGIPFELVSPAKWKAKVFDSSPRGKAQAEQKSAARDLARRLFPDAAQALKRVKDSDKAEALLLAEYGRRSHR